jgi:hypothetical protein
MAVNIKGRSSSKPELFHERLHTIVSLPHGDLSHAD